MKNPIKVETVGPEFKEIQQRQTDELTIAISAAIDTVLKKEETPMISAIMSALGVTLGMSISALPASNRANATRLVFSHIKASTAMAVKERQLESEGQG